jgi:hypothetical protein
MTAEEFEREYAAQSGITVERLRELGRIVAPCDCGEDFCEGWQSTTAERLAEEEEMRKMELRAAEELGVTVEQLRRKVSEIVEPGSPAWKARRAQILTDELRQPLRWFYLSFADADQFFGGALIEAHGPMHAMEQSHKLRIYPGGDCQTAVGEVAPNAVLPDGAKNRFLTREEIDTYFGPLHRKETMQ